MVLKKLDIHMQQSEIRPLLIPYTKVNWKWVKNLNKKTNSKNPKRKHRRKIINIGLGSYFDERNLCFKEGGKKKTKHKTSLSVCLFGPPLSLVNVQWTSSGQFSCLILSKSLQLHRLQHSRLTCLSPTAEACSNSCPSSQWCHPTISSSVQSSSKMGGPAPL